MMHPHSIPDGGVYLLGKRGCAINPTCDFLVNLSMKFACGGILKPHSHMPFAVVHPCARFVEPLDDYIRRDRDAGLTDVPDANDYYPSCWGEATYNGKVYAMGGLATCFTLAGTVEEYDPASAVLTPKANIPVSTYEPGIAASADGTRIFYVGSGNNGVNYSADSAINSIWINVTGVYFSGKVRSIACSANGRIVYAELGAGG